MSKFNRIILASASPRRRELLEKYADRLDILPQDCTERYTASEPERIVEEIARLKLGNLPQIYDRVPVVAADTIVWFDGNVIGKPHSEKSAYHILRAMSGKKHRVYTGYAVAYGGRITVGYDYAEVQFNRLTDREIYNYIATGSPMDKAGAYGIQDGVAVESYTGNADTIAGLPVDKVLAAIEELTDGKDRASD